MTQILRTFTNAGIGITAFVFVSEHKAGGFGVSLRDDDAEEMFPLTHHGIESLDAAIAQAMQAAGMLAVNGPISVAI